MAERPQPQLIWKPGDKITCYAITHAGEGERGAKVEILDKMATVNARYAAEQAAEYFDDVEKRTSNLEDSDFDGGSQVIEVEGVYDVPVRFRVRCKVVREYTVEPEA